MQNQGRLYEKDLRKYLYPKKKEYEREREMRRSPIAKRLFYSTNDNINKKQNINLYYRYDDQQLSPSSYILNKELSRNALGNTRDENQFSVLDNNNYTPFSYINKKYKPEGKIYHYSVATRKDYSRDKEEEYNSYNSYYYPEQKSRKYYIEKRSPNDSDYYYRRQGENILPTKVYISDTYSVKKPDQYKFRPSREKDGYKGGIVNLKRQKYSNSYEINSIILIQRWWRNFLYRYRSRNEYELYPSIASRKTYSKGNERITEKIIPGENDKFIVQTTTVEVFRNPYMSVPVLKPEIITKEIKLNSPKKNDMDINNDIKIVLDKETLKKHMRNIWNEENMSTSAESLSIVQNESVNTKINIYETKMININNYEEQIRQLKIALSNKEKELIECNNQLKSLSNKKYIENTYIFNEEDNLQISKNGNYLKKDEIAVFGTQKQFNDNLQIQLVDKLFIRNYPNRMKYKNKLYTTSENIIENIYNIEIIPIEKEPLKKQLIDSLYIQGLEEININEEEEIRTIYRGKKIHYIKFIPEKLLIEPSDNIEILPLEKEPLKKQLVDNLFIEKLNLVKPENKMQNVDKMTIFRTPRPQSMIEARENLEILPNEKEPLKKQLIDALFIEGLILLKSENKIQNVDKMSIFKTPKPQNKMEIRDNIEIIPVKKEKDNLKKQLVDDLYIERYVLLKPENKIQNIDKLSIFRTPKPDNIIEAKENLEILPLEKEPLKKQIIDALFIDGLNQIKSENKIQNTDKLSIFRSPKPQNKIEAKDNIMILPKEKEPLQKQLVDDLYIEQFSKIKPENKIQNTDKLSIFRTPRPQNMIEAKDNLMILPKEKEPLQKQLVDDLYIEQLSKIKPENKIQNTDKLSIFRTPKPQNKIEIKDNLEILPIEKEPLKKQLVDDLYIESIKLIKPENKIQNIDKLSLFEIPRADNMIEENENLQILPKEKEPLKKQITDALYVEGTKILPVHKNLVVDLVDGLEIIQNKENQLLKGQIIDSICIEGLPKSNNEIQNVSFMTILKKPRVPNIIESTEDLFIYPIEKEPLKHQVADILLIEGIDRFENEIQNVDKIEILKSPKQQIYVIEERENIKILPKEKQPLNKQLVDELLIEGNMKPDHKIQNVDKMEILRAPKAGHKIEEKESLFIPPKKKEPLNNQIIDSIIIEGTYRPDNKIQTVDKMDILRTPRPKNIIETNHNLFILPKEKEPLMKQLVDDLTIEKTMRPDNKIQNVDKVEILRSGRKPKNVIEEKESLFIAPKVKEPLKNQIVDNILIEGNIRDNNVIQLIDEINIIRSSRKPENIMELNDNIFIPAKIKEPLRCQIIDNIIVEGITLIDNEIQNVDKMEILRTAKPQNKIQENDTIFIAPKQKESLKQQLIDNIKILGIGREDNLIQNVDNIEIIRTSKPKPKIIIEQNDNLFIESKAKEPLNKQLVDELFIDGILRTSNEIQNVDKMDILRTPKPDNVIEENGNIFIKPEEKEKESFKGQVVDSIIIEGNFRPDNKIQTVDKMNILRTPKPENKMEQKEDIFIPPKQKEPLKKQLADDLLIEGKTKQNNNIVQQLDKFDIFKQPKPQNVIEVKENIYIPSKKKEELAVQLVDTLLIEEESRPDNIPQTTEKINILKSNKPKYKNVIEQNEDIFIPPKDKKPLEKQSCDKLLIEGNMTKPDNLIQNIDKIQLLEIVKPLNNIIQQNDELFIPSNINEREPYKSQIIDNILIEGNKNPENEIENVNKIEILKTIKPKTLVIEENGDVFIPSKVKIPLKGQIIDNILIEGNTHPDNKIQNVNKLEIIKTSKIVPQNVIEEKESIFIKSQEKEKEPFKGQVVDTILIEGNLKPDNKIQNVDKMDILRTPKPKNIIEANHNLFIVPKEKEPLKQKTCDNLLIEGVEIPENKIENKDKIEILRTVNPSKKENNIIEFNDNIFIPPKEKKPLKNKLIDSIVIEGIFKPDNKIDNAETIELLRAPKLLPKNIIEEVNKIFISPKEKKPLELQKVDNLLIEEMEKPNNEKQKVNEIEILKVPKSKNVTKNQIEENCMFYIQPKEKEPLEYQLLDTIKIEGSISPLVDNVIENVDIIEIPYIQEKRMENKIMEQSVNLFISPKEKEPLKQQFVDKILVEGSGNIRQNEIQTSEGFNIFKIPKPKNIIEEINSFNINPKEKEPLQNQSVDKLYIENLMPLFSGKKNLIENSDKFTLKALNNKSKEITIEEDEISEDNAKASREKPKNQKKPNNIIIKNDNFSFSPKEINKKIDNTFKKELLLKDKMDDIYIEKTKKPENIIEKTEKFDIFKISLPNKPVIVKPENKIEKTSEFNIPKTEKEPNEILHLDKLFIPKVEKEPFEIENIDKIIIGNIDKNEDEGKIPETITNKKNNKNNKIVHLESILMKPKKKDPLTYEQMDDINIDGEKRPDNVIETVKKLRIMRTEKPTNEIVYLEDISISPDISPDKTKEKKIMPYQIQTAEQINISRILKPQNKINNIDKIMLSSIEKGPLSKNKNDELFIKGNKESLFSQKLKSLQRDKIDELSIKGEKTPQNEIKNIDKIMLSSIEKKPLLKDNNEELFIEGNKKLLLPRKFENVEKDIIDELKVEGEVIPQNEIKNIDKIMLSSIEKQPLSKNKNDELFIEGEAIPKNEIKNIDKIMLSSIEKQPLSENKNDELFIEGSKKLLSKIFENIEKDKIDELKIEGEVIPQNEIKNIDKIMLSSIEKQPLSENKNDELFIEGNKRLLLPKRFDNIEKDPIDEFNIEGEAIPQNEIKNIDKIMLSSIEKQPLSENKNDELFIEGSKKLLSKVFENIEKDKVDELNIEGEVIPQNEIKNIDKIMLSSIEKQPLSENTNDELFIEGNKKSLPKIFDNVEKDIMDELYIEGIKTQQKPESQNEIISQEELFIAANNKEPLIEQKVFNLNFKSIKPQRLQQYNEIKNIDKILISSLEKPSLHKIKTFDIHLEGQNNEGQIKKKLNEIDSINSIFIPPRLKEPLKKEFINEIDIQRGKRFLFDNIIEEEKDKFYIKGKSPEEGQTILLKVRKYEICPQNEIFNIENSTGPEITQNILGNRYKKLIKPNLESSFIIKGEPQSKSGSIVNIPNPQKFQIYKKNDHFSILGNIKKPYIIENKGGINIISTEKKYQNNLIARGSCFGLFAKQNELGQKIPGIETDNFMVINQNWNDINRAQRTYNFNLDGNNKNNNNTITWNDFIVPQKGVKFKIDNNKKHINLKVKNEEQFSIIDKNEKDEDDDDEIVQGDYNYISLEKDDKQKRTIKATITKVCREVQDDDDNLNDLDPFSNCKKHTGKKYDKIFKERKTTSVRIRDDKDIRPGSIMSKEDEKKKPGTIIVKNDEINIGGSLYNDMNQRKTGPALFKNKKDKDKDKDKEKDINIFKDIGKSKSQVIFKSKSKEKKTEYLRDFDNDPIFFN